MFDMHKGGDGGGDGYERQHKGIEELATRVLADTVQQARNTGQCISCTVAAVVAVCGSHWVYNVARYQAHKHGAELQELIDREEDDEVVVEVQEAVVKARNDLFEGIRDQFAMRMEEGALTQRIRDLFEELGIDLDDPRDEEGKSGA